GERRRQVMAREPLAVAPQGAPIPPESLRRGVGRRLLVGEQLAQARQREVALAHPLPLRPSNGRGAGRVGPASPAPSLSRTRRAQRAWRTRRCGTLRTWRWLPSLGDGGGGDAPVCVCPF